MEAIINLVYIGDEYRSHLVISCLNTDIGIQEIVYDPNDPDFCENSCDDLLKL